MILRTLALAGGLAGAAVTSQFPEFSQQYLQRLGGAVDALGVVVADFDASAAAADLTRQEALEQMQGTAFLEARRLDMTATFTRYDALQNDLDAMQGAGPFMRAYHGARLTDGQIARAAWAAYQPALPMNFAGLSFAAVGFLLGIAVLSVAMRLIAWPFRRHRRAAMPA